MKNTNTELNAADLAEKIKLRAKHLNISINSMLLELKINKNMLNTITTRKSFPTSDNLAKIADYLDCSTDFLLGRTDNPQINNFLPNKKTPFKTYKDIGFKKPQKSKLKKVVNFCPQGRAAAGSPIFDPEAESVSVKVPKVYLTASIYTSVQVLGDSMEPELHDGDTVFAMKNTIPSNGHMALVHLKIDDPEDNGGYLIKIFRRISDTMVKLISLNSAYEPLYYNEAQIRSVEKVVYVFSPSK